LFAGAKENPSRFRINPSPNRAGDAPGLGSAGRRLRRSGLVPGGRYVDCRGFWKDFSRST